MQAETTIDAAGIQGIRRSHTVQNKLSREFRSLILLSLAHLPLGVAVYVAGPFALLHPIAVFCVGLYWAFNKRYRVEMVALAIAYLIGAEVLWRMAEVPVYWEFGKYGSAAIAIVALVSRGYYAIPALPVVYFAALIPGCLMTVFDRGLAASQATLSSQMSGPFFLMIACWFFAHCKFDPLALRRVLYTVAIPLFSVGFATFFFTVSSEDIQFTGESNFATSGGFGPNQVSAMLGLGVFVSLACLLIFKQSTKYRIYFMIAAIVFTADSVMTFSRGGIYNAVGAIAVVTLIELRDPKGAAKRLAPVIVLAAVFLLLVFPALNGFTGGQLGERFGDTGTASRTEIAETDVQLFLDNPVTGVGVGNSYQMRAELLDRKAMTHTEFSRLLSEHGIFGVVALVSLALMIILNFKKQRSVLGQAFVAGAAVWCCLFMTNAAMRLAAPAFMWGLMYSTIVFRPQRPRKPVALHGEPK